MNKIAIMGFGNPVRSDDAVGCYVIDELTAYYMNSRDVTLFDMGTSAFEILFKLKGHDYIIVVDGTINSGEAPGTIFKLPASEVESAPQDDPMVFLHSLKWDQALSYAKKILREEYPDNIDVYLVAIDNTKLGEGMSEEVEKAGDIVVDLIRKSIAEVGV